MYIGRTPEVGNYRKADSISVVNGQATYNLTVNGEAVNPNANQVICSLNGVVQSSNDSFSIASNQITFASNLQTGDVIDFILILGDTLDVGTPSDNTVGITQLNVSDGTNGQALTTNGSGTLSFSTVGVSGISSASSSTALNIDSSGHITQPLQSAFHAKLGTIASNVTGDGTDYDVSGFGTERVDRNSDFNTTSGIFTAPVTGLYALSFTSNLSGIDSSMNDNQFKLVTSNEEYGFLGEVSSSSIGFSGAMKVAFSMIVDMDASDTAFVRIDFRGSSKTVDVSADTVFSGYLLG